MIQLHASCDAFSQNFHAPPGSDQVSPSCSSARKAKSFGSYPSRCPQHSQRVFSKNSNWLQEGHLNTRMAAGFPSGLAPNAKPF
jgi:hypothetical protein